MKSQNCFFCKQGKQPDFKEVESLKKFLTIRGKIVAREKSKVCALHQRKLAREIKKARALMLLPYVMYER